MSEVIDLPYRRIRGTKEWQAEQKRLRAAWEVIEGRMTELGIRPLTLEAGDAVPAKSVEDTLLGALGMTLKPGELARAARAARLMRLLEQRGSLNRVMCQERRTDGRQCRYPVAEGAAMCRAHAEWKASALGSTLPFPDDALGLQRLMAKLLSGLLYEGMDAAKARVAADVCRTMRQNIEACERAAAEAEREFFL